MAERSWTKSQKDAISARRGTVLVAAAAGSGKTAVLVQRALERLTDTEHPTSADKLLVVTFTKAAAAEMRARLERELYDLVRKNPESSLLRRQSVLLSQAHIGTVDSFCAEMVREFFHLLDLTPDFKILSDKQEEELIASSLDEVLHEAFQAGSVEELADAFAGERDDRQLSAMVLSLYRFMQSHPFPQKWLQEKTALYGKNDIALWENVILEYVRETAEHCRQLLASAQEFAKKDPKIQKAFSGALALDLQDCAKLENLASSGDWDGALDARKSFALHRRGALRNHDEDPLLLKLEAIRQEVKKAMKSLEKCLSATRAEGVAELHRAKPLIESLGELTLAFSKRYEEKKREFNFLDYSDLEHCAIRLFREENGEPTQAAKEVSQRFDEIMIDEYQDTNEVQDSLFRAVSKEEKNLFMVGDVKQSIYGFRQAMPEIFLGWRRKFLPYDSEKDLYPASIVLDRNFRSRREVTDTVNFVFSRLMSRSAGDIDYSGEERLVCGADYADKPGCETELQFLSREKGVTAEEAEARWIAKRIREMVESGFTVTDRDGERPIGWGDFCVLLRSANKYAYAYAQEMSRLGVPAKAAVSGGFFAAAEVRMVLSFLQVIDNPNQDIPLLAVLMSPVYGFTADDAARLRAENKHIPMYLSLLKSAKEDERCKRVVREIGQYRAVAATMPSDGFLTFLYGKTGFLDLVSAMEGGEGRLWNLRLLQQYAREYEGSGYNGVSGFVRFLDRIRQSDSDLRAAEPKPGEEGAVSVMSVHRSKGLEFPVCFVAGCHRNFVNEGRENVLLHPRLGLGVKLKDPARPAKYTTTVREAIALESARSAAAEELRVLYVAMTRAKEKLILVSSGERIEDDFSKLSLELGDQGITPYTVRSAKNAAQWLMLCALCHPDGEKLRRETGVSSEVVCRKDHTPWKIGLDTAGPEPQQTQEEVLEQEPPDEVFLEQVKKNLAFSYPFAQELNTPAKVAASKLSAQLSGEREVSLSRPAWLGEQGMTPAERGIALHEYMQFADFHRAAQDPDKELERLVEKAYLTPEQAGAVELSKVRNFFEGRLGKRVLSSPDSQKERRFTAAIPPSMALTGREAPDDMGERVILQGSVDCTFTENGLLHIIDFKTDRVENMETLWERYGVQIRLYAYAMEEVTGQKVGEMILYSTHLSRGEARLYRDEEKGAL